MYTYVYTSCTYVAYVLSVCCVCFMCVCFMCVFCVQFRAKALERPKLFVELRDLSGNSSAPALQLEQPLYNILWLYN